MTTAIIGIGNIGGTVACDLAAGGEPVVLSAVNADDLAKLAAEIGSRATAAASNREAVQRADAIVLALWLGPMKTVIDEIADLLPGKLVIDTSNPISVGAYGNVSRPLPDGQSAGEVVSVWLPKGARYAKAFGTLPAPLLGSSAHRTPKRAVLFYTTDDTASAPEVERLIGLAGFEPVRAGGVRDSLRIEVGGVLHALVDRLRDGGGTVVVRGEAGIGKSVLLQRVRGRAEAQGARPLVTVGVESEAEVAFAGLHQLLRPVIGALAQQPESQRQVLEAALGLGVDHAPDPFRVAVAAFQLICDVADSVPLVLIVDDAQWLDRSTLNVIAFIARRLEVEHVGLVAAIRREQAAPFDDARLPTIDLERLSASAAAHLLDREAPELHPVVRARVLAEASGNPLALVELATSMGRSGVQLSAPPTTLTARLDRAFANRLGELAPYTRAALLAAAPDSRASLDEIP